MRRPPGMDNGDGIGKSFHQKPCATGMVKVNMRQQDIVDLIASESFFFQSFEQIRYSVVGAGIHEGRPALIDQQMTGRETGSQIVRINRTDVMRKIADPGVLVHKQVTVG